MAEMTTTDQINRSLEPKRVDQFYVKFFKLEDNTANILGRQVRSVGRPSFSLREFDLPHKGKPRMEHGFLEFSETSVEFWDDDQSLTTKALYEQVYRQLGTGGYKRSESFQNARFELEVDIFDASGKQVENFRLLNCFINNISHSQQVYSNATEQNIITVSVKYDDVQYSFDF